MNKLFLEYKTEMQSLVDNDDYEYAHGAADDFLKQIAISAAKGELNEVEVVELIELYDNVGKWYS